MVCSWCYPVVLLCCCQWGLTAVMWAARTAQVEVVVKLTELGANLTGADLAATDKVSTIACDRFRPVEAIIELVQTKPLSSLWQWMIG